MKNRFLTFIIGIWFGVIITTSCFFVYFKNFESNRMAPMMNGRNDTMHAENFRERGEKPDWKPDRELKEM